MFQRPKVSVCMITYGHEKFIEEAINGVLMQECNFGIELIVANDCSPDSTNKLIKKIIETHPRGHWIKYVNHKENLGMMPNFIWGLKQCKGNYIGLCEGDDYWTDPLKLQKQVSFLDENDDYNICFHKTGIYNQAENKLEIDTISREVPETTDIDELAIGNFIHTPSVVLRNNFELPNWFSESPIGDWILYMIAVKDKKIRKLDEVMAVYRVHDSSIWSLKTAEFRILNTLESIKLLLNSSEIKVNVKNILNETIKKFENDLPQKPHLLVQLLKKAKVFLKV